MKVEDPRSAFESVNAVRGSKRLIRIQLRREPKLSFAQIRQMITSLSDVTHVRMGFGDHFDDSYFVELNQKISQERLNELVSDLCKLASVVV